VGARVLVQAAQAADTQLWTAVHVVVQTATSSETESEETTPAHVVGTVTAYTAGSSITVQGADGTLATYALTATTKILPAARASLLAVGARVTIIAAPASAGGTPTATGIVVHPAGKGSPAPATPVPTSAS
jgi:hypothetical protein